MWMPGRPPTTPQSVTLVAASLVVVVASQALVAVPPLAEATISPTMVNLLWQGATGLPGLVHSRSKRL